MMPDQIHTIGLRLVGLAVCLAVGPGCGGLGEWPGAADPLSMPGSSPAGGLEGRVVDGEGVAVGGAYITTDPGGVETVTDGDGLFHVERLTPGAYAVVVKAAGFDAARSAGVDVEDGGVGAVAAITLTPEPPDEGELRVRVVGPDGGVWSGARVVAVGPKGKVGGVVDADGRVTLGGLGGTTVEVSADDGGSGRLWPATRAGVSVPLGGGADLALSLAGRAADGTVSSGSDVCGLCHVDEAGSFLASAHARALTEFEGTPAAAFDEDTVVALGGASAQLGWVDGLPVVRLTSAGGSTDTWEVMGFLGGEDRGAVPWGERDGRAWPLPLAWVPPERDHEEWAPGGWVAGDLTAWFDASRDFAYDVHPAESASAEAACFGCHATGFQLGLGGDGEVEMTAATHSTGRWDEPGVGCEACHGPGVDHSSGPLNEMGLRITNPADLGDARANDVCAQCHGALAGGAGTAYAWNTTHGRFRPGEVLGEVADAAFVGWASGAAAIPGAEADELAASGHATAGWSARCTDCHDPHGSEAPALLRVDNQDNTLCVGCHLATTFHASSAELESHTQHVYAPDSATESGRCTGCHMPDTAARLAWSPLSGGGDLASHRFVAIPPSDSLAAFDAAGVDTLPPGGFVTNACQECHAWNDWLFGGYFPGPTGDMTRRATHEALQAAFVKAYP